MTPCTPCTWVQLLMTTSGSAAAAWWFAMWWRDVCRCPGSVWQQAQDIPHFMLGHHLPAPQQFLHPPAGPGYFKPKRKVLTSKWHWSGVTWFIDNRYINQMLYMVPMRWILTSSFILYQSGQSRMRSSYLLYDILSSIKYLTIRYLELPVFCI